MKTYKATLKDECTLQEDGAIVDITKMKSVSDSTYTENYIVEGIAPDLTPGQKLKSAINAVGIPKMYSLHPDISNAMVRKRQASLVTPTIAKVKVVYETDSGDLTGDEIEVGATVVEVETVKDIKGDLIKVDYNGRTQTGRVKVRVPMVTARITRQEGSHPLDKAKRYVGKTSNGGPLGGSAGQWLCMGIVGKKSDNGMYVVDYDFEFDENKHVQTAAFKNDDGEIPDGAKEGNGLKTVRMYENTEFPIKNLNL